MIGTAGLKGLRVECVVGIYEQERARTQPVTMDIELDYDFGAAAASDSIQDAVDYDVVARGIAELLQRRKFQLIETMAEESARMIFAQLAPVQAVRLEIRKPEAVPAAECSFVRLERRRT
jgi:dihydroneopterin aldolase